MYVEGRKTDWPNGLTHTCTELLTLLGVRGEGVESAVLPPLLNACGPLLTPPPAAAVEEEEEEEGGSGGRGQMGRGSSRFRGANDIDQLAVSDWKNKCPKISTERSCV